MNGPDARRRSQVNTRNIAFAHDSATRQYLNMVATMTRMQRGNIGTLDSQDSRQPLHKILSALLRLFSNADNPLQEQLADIVVSPFITRSGVTNYSTHLACSRRHQQHGHCSCAINLKHHTEHRSIDIRTVRIGSASGEVGCLRCSRPQRMLDVHRSFTCCTSYCFCSDNGTTVASAHSPEGRASRCSLVREVLQLHLPGCPGRCVHYRSLTTSSLIASQISCKSTSRCILR